MIAVNRLEPFLNGTEKHPPPEKETPMKASGLSAHPVIETALLRIFVPVAGGKR
jgi:hypothetical protein